MTTTVETFNAQQFFADAYQPLVDAFIDQQKNDIIRKPLVEVSFPAAGHKWLLTEYNPEHAVGFGLCDLGMGCPELGYVDITEIHEVVAQFGLQPQCRVMNALHAIDEYAEAARAEQSIMMLPEADNRLDIPLTEFLQDFREPLLSTVANQLPPLFEAENVKLQDDTVIDGLLRSPLGPQREKIHTILSGLITHKMEAVVLNGEMGTGKTYVSIATAAVYHQYNPKPTLVMCPPHLVYKWRREILSTIANAKVTVINGSDAINKLLRLREDIIHGRIDNRVPNFIVIGRVRMRMGFHWKPAYTIRKKHSVYKLENGETSTHSECYVACPKCGEIVTDNDKNDVDVERFEADYADKQHKCKCCGSPLWTMQHRANEGNDDKDKQLMRFLQKLPGIGKATAAKMVNQFGCEQLTNIIDDNIYEFVNLYDPNKPGEFYFSDKKAERLERALGRLEFALRFISYHRVLQGFIELFFDSMQGQVTIDRQVLFSVEYVDFSSRFFAHFFLLDFFARFALGCGKENAGTLSASWSIMFFTVR